MTPCSIWLETLFHRAVLRVTGLSSKVARFQCRYRIHVALDQLFLYECTIQQCCSAAEIKISDNWLQFFNIYRVHASYEIRRIWYILYLNSFSLCIDVNCTIIEKTTREYKFNDTHCKKNLSIKYRKSLDLVTVSVLKLIGDEIKWPPFCRWHFHFLYQNNIFVRVLLKYVPSRPIDKNSTISSEKWPGAEQATSNYLNRWW